MSKHEASGLERHSEFCPYSWVAGTFSASRSEARRTERQRLRLPRPQYASE